MKPQIIQVRRYLPDQTPYGSESIGAITGNYGKFELVETVKRRVYCDQVGNSNRFACRYKGQTFCVNSDAGDIGDPFRADESYLASLYINVNRPCQWHLHGSHPKPVKFKLDINLDDEVECEKFIETYGTSKGRLLANALKLSGPGSTKLADKLSGYAWNKSTSIDLRKRGDIATAKMYEDICDRIYREDIQPNCECW